MSSGEGWYLALAVVCGLGLIGLLALALIVQRAPKADEDREQGYHEDEER